MSGIDPKEGVLGRRKLSALTRWREDSALAWQKARLRRKSGASGRFGEMEIPSRPCDATEDVRSYGVRCRSPS